MAIWTWFGTGVSTISKEAVKKTVKEAAVKVASEAVKKGVK